MDQRITKFLERYQALSGHITVTEVDPVASPAQASQYAGSYGDGTGIASVTAGTDSLTLTLPTLLGGSSLELFPYDDGSFRDETGSVAIRFAGEEGMA